MNKIPVSILEGPLLAEFVARAQEFTFGEDDEFNGFWWYYKKGIRILEKDNGETYRPDINGKQAMELQTEFRFIAGFAYEEYDGTPVYFCQFGRFATDREHGNTLEIAICRAVVASKFGEYVVVNNDSSCGTMEVEE